VGRKPSMQRTHPHTHPPPLGTRSLLSPPPWSWGCSTDCS
jgi:hypothetical protein